MKERKVSDPAACPVPHSLPCEAQRQVNELLQVNGMVTLHLRNKWHLLLQ